MVEEMAEGARVERAMVEAMVEEVVVLAGQQGEREEATARAKLEVVVKEEEERAVVE